MLTLFIARAAWLIKNHREFFYGLEKKQEGNAKLVTSVLDKKMDYIIFSKNGLFHEN